MTERYDNSMLACFLEQCPRKYFFEYEHQLVSPKSQAAPTFGRGIHRAGDVFFTGGTVDEAIAAFKSLVPTDLDEEKRTLENAEAIIRGYYKEYNGSISPFTEVLGVEKGLLVDFGDFEFFGLLDKVVNWAYGITALDHKTTSLYLSNYGKTVQPKHQYTGYIYLLRELYENAWGLVVDAIHVGKKLKSGWRTEYTRFLTTRGEWEIDEWKKWVRASVKGIRQARESNEWLMFTNECTAFNSACPYKPLCEVPYQSLEETLAYAKQSGDYFVRVWEPWKEVMKKKA